MKDLVEIQIPFSGFYESWHDEKCSEAVESAFNYNHETDEDQELPEAFWDADINWSAIFRDYAKAYSEVFGEELGLDVEFIEMSSPREYNFTTDRLFVKVPREQIDAIKDKVFADKEASEYVSERFTSRDGFWSHYSNDLTDEEWTAETLDECQYGVILEAYVDMQHRDDPNNVREWSEREWELVEDFELYGWDSVIDAQNAVDEQIKKEAKNVKLQQ